MSRKFLPQPFVPGLLAGSILLSPTAAIAAGFKLMEQSVSLLGRSYAGESLAADDASAAFYNPADMLLLKGNYLQTGVTNIDLSANFHDEASTISLAPAVPFGDGNENAGTSAFVPFFHYVADLHESVRFGLAVTAPFGLSLDYDDNWVGRYHVTDVSLGTIDLNTSIAYKLTPQINIGFGLSYQYVEATLENKIFTGESDLSSELSADDWSWGFNAGVTGDFGDSRISLAYRSHIEHDLRGDAKITGVPETTATATIELPATTTLSGWHRLNDRWEIMASLRYTEWDSLQSLIIHTGYGTDITPTNWKDVWAGAVGANFQWSETRILRLGIAYDSTPIRHEEYRTPRVPDGDRLWLSLGARFKVGESAHIDVAYAHLFANDASTNSTVLIADGLGTATLDGEFDDLSADLLGVQITYKF